MRKFTIYSVIMFLFLSASAKNFIPNANLIGQGSLYYVFWHIYDASLYSNGKFSFKKPFVLTLDYKRKLSGVKIADRSAIEIRKLGFEDEIKLAGWRSQMRDIFPDVKNGSQLSGVYNPNKPTTFFNGDVLAGTIKDPDFGKWFFGIWLSEKTSNPKLRKALLGDR